MLAGCGVLLAHIREKKINFMFIWCIWLVSVKIYEEHWVPFSNSQSKFENMLYLFPHSKIASVFTYNYIFIVIKNYFIVISEFPFFCIFYGFVWQATFWIEKTLINIADTK